MRDGSCSSSNGNETFELATDLEIVKLTDVVVVVLSVCAASSSHQSAAAVVLHTESAAGFSSGLASDGRSEVATSRSVTEWSCRRTGVIITRGEYNTLSKSVYISARGRSRKDNSSQVELTWRAFYFGK